MEAARDVPSEASRPVASRSGPVVVAHSLPAGSDRQCSGRARSDQLGTWVVVAHSVPGRRRVLCFYCSLKLCLRLKCVGDASALRTSCTVRRWCLQPLQAPRWLVSIIDRAMIDPAIPTQSCQTIQNSA